MSIELIGEESKNNNKRNANIFQEIDLISLDYSLRFSIKMHLIFAAMQFNVRDKNNCQSVKKKRKKEDANYSQQRAYIRLDLYAI